eukprot:15334464-Ditylum_brightwellii.AAC.1
MVVAAEPVLVCLLIDVIEAFIQHCHEKHLRTLVVPVLFSKVCIGRERGIVVAALAKPRESQDILHVSINSSWHELNILVEKILDNLAA